MKYLSILPVLFLLSCMTTKIMPLTENYPSTPMIFTSDKSFDKTWDNLVDIFAQKGLSIRIIDRSSGLIVSNKSTMSATIESKIGGLQDPNAFIAVPYYMSGKNRVSITTPYVGAYARAKDIMTNPVFGDWNVRIKSNPSGGSSINVNITDVGYEYLDPRVKMSVVKEVPITTYKSTGVFEKQLADLINH